MPALVYIHGFLSSPQSFKAQQIEQWLAANHSEITYYCPQLTPYPELTRRQLEILVESLLPEPVYLVGSSLGGFWATWLVEKYGLRAVLINPAVRPQEFMPNYLGQELKNYHLNARYFLTPEHIDDIIRANVAPNKLNHYWLLLQTGDEILDYRQAVATYAGCRQTIEEGGDHSFKDVDRYFDEMLTFFSTT